MTLINLVRLSKLLHINHTISNLGHHINPKRDRNRVDNENDFSATYLDFI